MIEFGWAIVAGVVLGGLFRLVNLPIPAPITIAGVAGVFGVWAGFQIVERLVNG